MNHPMYDGMKGKLITLEGADGSGKSTCRDYIAEVIESYGIEVVRTREPGGTPFAEEIRELLLRPRAEEVSVLAEMMLFWAARAQHLRQVIMPAIERGAVVVCDRFVDSTFAYQVAGRGFSRETTEQLLTMVLGSFRPDLVIVLDVDPLVGMERAGRRGMLDRFEAQHLSFFDAVRHELLERAEANPARYRVVDANQELKAVKTDLVRIVREVFSSKSTCHL